MAEENKPEKTMPKGGRKGGAMFPRMDLKTGVGHAKRLVSKTHTGAQTKEVIYSGVLDATGGRGDVKMSAIKQYGFMDGSVKEGFTASQAAKDLASAPPDEIIPHYRAAVLRPKIFQGLFKTFHGDSVTSAKLKQRAAALHVHPDETDTCVQNYLESAQLAGLVSLQGDLYKHISDSELSEVPAQKADDMREGDPPVAEESEKKGEDKGKDNNIEQRKDVEDKAGQRKRDEGDAGVQTPRAIFNVNVTLDSSLDTEKLQKQLELLKRFGAL